MNERMKRRIRAQRIAAVAVPEAPAAVAVEDKPATQSARAGDIFCVPAPDLDVLRVVRASRTGTWVDVEKRNLDGTVAWARRLPYGIPATWSRYPRP